MLTTKAKERAKAVARDQVVEEAGVKALKEKLKPKRKQQPRSCVSSGEMERVLWVTSVLSATTLLEMRNEMYRDSDAKVYATHPW